MITELTRVHRQPDRPRVWVFWHRLILGTIAALIGTVGLVAPAATSTAAPTMTVDQFVTTYQGRYWDYDGIWGAQCADLFEYYNRDVVGAPFIQFDYAYQLWANFPSPAPTYYTRLDASASPVKGDVAVWSSQLPGSGGAGHVAIVLSQIDASTLQVIQQNAPVGSKTIVSTAGKKYLLGYLRPKNLPGVTASLSNVAAVSTGGVFYAKQGGLNTNWLTMTSGIASVKISGNNALALTTDGTLLGKEGGFSTTWLTLGGGIKSFDLS